MLYEVITRSVVKSANQNDSCDIVQNGDTKIIDFLKNLNEKVKVFLIPGNWETSEVKQRMNESGLNIDEKIVKFEDRNNFV